MNTGDLIIEYTVADPPDDSDDDDGDGDGGGDRYIHLGATMHIADTGRGAHVVLPPTASIGDIANAMFAIMRATAATHSPVLAAIIDASLLDTSRDAMLFVTDDDVHTWNLSGANQLTSAVLERADRHFRTHQGRPLQAVRIGIDGELVSITALRAILKAAGR